MRIFFMGVLLQGFSSSSRQTQHNTITTLSIQTPNCRSPFNYWHPLEDYVDRSYPPTKFRSRSNANLPPLSASSLAISGNAPSPSQQKLYQLSSTLMAAVALLLLLYFPQFHSEHQLLLSSSSVSMVRRRQMSLGTQFGAASGFGIASYLFFWLQPKQLDDNTTWKHLPRLSRQLHVALMLFCGVGMGAVPGEMGMLRLTGEALAVPSKQQLVVSSLGLILSIVARGVGMWTSLWGWKQLNAGIQLEEHENGNDSSHESSNDKQNNSRMENMEVPSSMTQSLDIPSDYNVVRRVMTVPKSHRRQNAPFYRNILFLLLCGAGSNLMDVIFRCRYHKALSRSFSTLDISLNVSAVARLLLLAAMVLGLKVGSETLSPTLTSATSQSWTMAERRDEFQSKRQSTIPSTPPPTKLTTDEWNSMERTVDQSRSKRLAEAMARINLLAATWPLLIFLGQNLTVFLLPGGTRGLTGLPYLLLSGLLVLKGYRFHMCTTIQKQ